MQNFYFLDINIQMYGQVYLDRKVYQGALHA